MDISPISIDISASYGSWFDTNDGRAVGVLAFSSFKYAASYIGRDMVAWSRVGGMLLFYCASSNNGDVTKHQLTQGAFPMPACDSNLIS